MLRMCVECDGGWEMGCRCIYGIGEEEEWHCGIVGLNGFVVVFVGAGFPLREQWGSFVVHCGLCTIVNCEHCALFIVDCSLCGILDREHRAS